MTKKLQCKTCGKHIKGCPSCEGKIHNWRNVACTPECYQIYIKKELERRDSVERQSHKES